MMNQSPLTSPPTSVQKLILIIEHHAQSEREVYFAFLRLSAAKNTKPIANQKTALSQLRV